MTVLYRSTVPHSTTGLTATTPFNAFAYEVLVVEAALPAL